MNNELEVTQLREQPTPPDTLGWVNDMRPNGQPPEEQLPNFKITPMDLAIGAVGVFGVILSLVKAQPAF
jgi:hypothetical protein